MIRADPRKIRIPSRPQTCYGYTMVAEHSDSEGGSPPGPMDSGFWESPGIRVFLPARMPVPDALRDGDDLGLPAGAVVFSSSGTSGDPKLAVLTRRSLLASARAVVDWLGITGGDRLLCPLPLHHVGGFGLMARAKASGAAFRSMEIPWDAGEFTAMARDWQATMTSLVPTQVYDLVCARVAPPASLRLIVVGGSHLAADLDSEARQLGWPILPSFGMTETSSQIATAKPGMRAPGPGWLPVIHGWEVANDSDGLLRVRGEGLFAGNLLPREGGWTFVPATTDGGWFTTSDYAEIATDHGQCWLLPRGRADDSIKIRGELVALSAAARELDGLARAAGLPPARVAIIDVADPRAGRALVLVGESAMADQLPALRDAFNRRAPAFARIERIAAIPVIPRSPLGKLQRANLRSLLGSHT